VGAILATPGFAIVETRVQLLPDVIDVSVVLTGAGFGGLLTMSAGAAMRLEPDRLGRVTMLGQLVGAAAAGIGLAIGLLVS
jgi:hypothetical protein